MKKQTKAEIMAFLSDFENSHYSKEGKYMGVFGLSRDDIAKLTEDLYFNFDLYLNEKQKKG